MTDTDLMPWGKHKGKAMINVPADYLLWLLANNKCAGEVKKYIEYNLDVLEKEALEHESKKVAR